MQKQSYHWRKNTIEVTSLQGSEYQEELERFSLAKVLKLETSVFESFLVANLPYFSISSDLFALRHKRDSYNIYHDRTA